MSTAKVKIKLFKTLFEMTGMERAIRLAILTFSLALAIVFPSPTGLMFATATGAVILAPTGGSRYIVDITFAATDTTFAITHGISDPKSICMSQNTVGTVNPTGLVWTRTSATVTTISKDSLTNSAVLLRVELAVPSTIS